MRAIERTVAIFECFQPSRTSLSLKEIASRVKLSSATTFRLVRSLEAVGYLVRLQNQEYSLSFRFVRLAGLVDNSLEIKQIARPIMIALAKRSNELVTLNTISGHFRVCIDSIDMPSPLMSIRKAGEHVPLVTGATSKTLMANLEGVKQEQAIRYAMKASGATYANLIKELKTIRRHGYAVTYGEHVLGLGAVAAPILLFDNRMPYCLSIAGPTVRIRPKAKELISFTVKAAADISRFMGGN